MWHPTAPDAPLLLKAPAVGGAVGPDSVREAGKLCGGACVGGPSQAGAVALGTGGLTCPRTPVAPVPVGQASTRIRKNVHYFKVNYLIWLVTVAVVCMLANPRSLLVLFGLGSAWGYVFVVRGDAPLVIAGRAVSEREKLVGAAAISVAVIFFLTSVGSVLFSALCIGLAGVAVHGALRVPDDLFLDDVAQPTSFLPSFSVAPRVGAALA